MLFYYWVIVVNDMVGDFLFYDIIKWYKKEVYLMLIILFFFYYGYKYCLVYVSRENISCGLFFIVFYSKKWKLYKESNIMSILYKWILC